MSDRAGNESLRNKKSERKSKNPKKYRALAGQLSSQVANTCFVERMSTLCHNLQKRKITKTLTIGMRTACTSKHPVCSNGSRHSAQTSTDSDKGILSSGAISLEVRAPREISHKYMTAQRYTEPYMRIRNK